ncbi:TonB-dependent receptor [Sphingobacterium rhinopitheci]|uniref:TonB-dependent receptor n=1 Tax=Sphingobacterium rhinopitheci TaxID=2781960 RepID=UPI001F525B65|nr:TonB-dependent receptor [Sphingobacterium rhinopitheci]MCI0922394.1 TonB-dependent receptor [Sphingobacterium rhinopitheci]
MRRLLLSILFLFFSINTFSQTKISGIVVDGADNGKLEKASIAILNQVDSILVKFAWTKDNGSFLLTDLDTGSYKLIVSYPKYADYTRDFQLTNEDINIGTLKLSKAALLLEEVSVTGAVPIVLKGDTTVYNASSFQVAKDANVEDLLKVLPGITVDANGNITAQGKEVKKVLLDGEEFFGNDPKLITKNIRSNMVDKVMVYEKKSDVAVRTGIDDGERTQTIDITLKQDMKKGTFGQVLAGGGTDRYYGFKGMVNKFKGSEKIAAYGIYSNDGMVSLGFEDGQKYGVGGSTNVQAEDGAIFITSSSDDVVNSGWAGNYNGNGVPTALNLGASYSNKFNKDKHKLNVNYQRAQMSVDNNRTYFSQNNLPDIARIENSTGFTNNETKNNNANVRYDFKVDSLADITFKFGYAQTNRDNKSYSNSQDQNLDFSLINEVESDDIGHRSSENINASILLTRKFLKLRRSITLNSSIASNKDNGNANYYSLTQFANNDPNLLIDQYKTDNSKNTNFNASLSYSEPLSKRWTGTVGYAVGNNTNAILNKSFDKDPSTGLYDILDQNQLNDFNQHTISNAVNAGVNYKNDKLTFNASNRFSFETVERVYNTLNSTLNRNQQSVAPTVSANYKITKSKNLSFYYNGRTTQPSLNQIEPLNQNRETVVNYLPNPDLQSGFRNSYNLYFNSYKQIKDQSFYSSIYMTQSFNAVTAKVNYFSETGKRDIQYVNIKKPNTYISFYSEYRQPIWKRFNLSGNLGGSLNYNNSFNYLSVNNGESELNNNETYNITPNIGFNSYIADKWSFYVNVNPGFQFMKSTLQPDLNSNTFTFSSYFNFNYTLTKGIKVGFNGNQSYEAATQTLKAFNVFNMNGFISKKFFKDKSLETQLFVNDIFNRNSGVRRSQSGYAFTQTTNDVLHRYAMLKLIYNFTSMKGGE